MGATPICTISATGILKPSLAECLAYFTNGYAGIYGQDVVQDSATEDTEFLGLLSSALDDTNAMAVNAYQAYSPATAQGAGLSSNVKINGIRRASPTQSTVPIINIGQQGVTVNAGAFSDPNGNVWTIAPFVIPALGQVTALATCQTQGAVALNQGVTSGVGTGGLSIINPQPGWQKITTGAAATLGAPVETDAQLRIRQAESTQIPASTMLNSIAGAVWALPGVTRLLPYQNSTNAIDANGVPGNSIAIVVEGGDPVQIASVIEQYKFACGTWGTTTTVLTDAYGVPHPINFFYATLVPIVINVVLNPYSNFSVNTNALIQQSMAAWVNSLGIWCGGTGNVQLSRAFGAAYLQPLVQEAAIALQNAVVANDQVAIVAATSNFTATNQASTTYEVVAITMARGVGIPGAGDVPIAYFEDPNIAVDVYGNPTNPNSVTVTP